MDVPEHGRTSAKSEPRTLHCNNEGHVAIISAESSKNISYNLPIWWTASPTQKGLRSVAISMLWLLSALLPFGPTSGPSFRAELVFPLHPQHNHAPSIVECPNGDLLVSWYRGSGERKSDDVAVYGARQRKGSDRWSEPFLLADMPGFPDCNTAMFIDSKNRLWLFWPVILANSWESCLTNYRIASDYLDE
jgi:hypothetical protein